MIPEVFVYYPPNTNDKIVFYRSSDTWSRLHHDPWFLVDTIPKFKNPEHEEIFDKLVKSIDYTDIRILIFSEDSWRYGTAKIAIKLSTHHPLDVRKLTRLLEKYGVHYALSNVRYVSRVSLDLAKEIFEYKAPLILHYNQDELEPILVDVYEKARKVKVAVIDIEVESKGSFPRQGDRVLLAGYAIVSIDQEEPEVTILELDDVYKLTDVLLKSGADYLVTFNGIGFDLPYYRSYTSDSRIVIGGQQAGVLENLSIVPLLDLYLFAKRYGQPLGLKSHTSRSLDQVAKDLSLITKEEEEIERSIDRNNIAREYRDNKQRLLKYLETDVKLTFRIAKKWLPVLILLYSITGISPYSQQWLASLGSLSEYSLSEYLLRKHGVALEVRSRFWSFGEFKNRFIPWISQGHKNISITGIFDNVLQVDFDMLYPTISYEYNVDPTSLSISDSGFPIILYKEVEVKEGKSKRPRKKVSLSEAKTLRVVFSGGPVHEFFSYTYTLRRTTKKIKKERKIEEPDSAVKVLANSVYGIFSKTRGSGLNEAVSAFIFTKANQILNATRRYVEQVIGRRIVYGDTDSLFIEIREGDDPNKIVEEINRFIKIFGNSFSVKLENIHKRIAVYSSKNYVGITRDNEVIVKGLHRFYAPQIIKENLNSIIISVINGADPEAVVKQYLENTSKLEDLFVYSAKSLDELYDPEKQRFKDSSHPATRALLLEYLRSIVGYIPTGNHQILNVAKDIVVTRNDINSNIVLSSYWLSKSSDTVCILLEPVSNRARLLCGRFIAKPRVDGEKLVQPTIIWVEDADKERLVSMCARTARTALSTLKTIYTFLRG